MSITAHCLVKNEEKFVGYAIKSVIDYVDKLLVFDTGSTDKTVQIINELKNKYPGKIDFEEKGLCDKKRHTELRQEMISRTVTDWFMILDGDEIWTKRSMLEAVSAIKDSTYIECLIVPFYLCVGDQYHRSVRNGSINILGKTGFMYPRFLKKCHGIHWKGDYNEDSLYDENDKVFFDERNTLFLENKYWHLTNLVRSEKDFDDYSSGGRRSEKRVGTYFLIGTRINEDLPEVFFSGDNLIKLSFFRSLMNFPVWIIRKLTKSFGKR